MASFEDVRLRARLETATLEAWVEARWLVPRHEAARPNFSEADVARACLIRDLRDDLGVNDEGVAVILSLLDQIHGLRRTLGDVLEAVRTQPEAVQRDVATALERLKAGPRPPAPDASAPP